MSDSHSTRVLGLSGSFRKASYNAMALGAAIELAPPGMRIDRYDYRDIPFYDGDSEAESGLPAPVEKLREAIRTADAVLIVTPEYNTSMPGLLKNALDWTSRGAGQPMAGKPVAVMGASPGMFGTIRAQQHLRQMLLNVGAQVVVGPQVAIGNAGQRFNAEGRLTDEATRKFVADLLANLASWAHQLRK